MNMEILVLSFQEGNLSVVIAHLDLILPREGVSRSHVDSSFHPHLILYSCKNNHYLACW